MRLAALLLGVFATQSAAEVYTCILTDDACVADCPEMSVRFNIDPSQFVAPIDPNDPPRRQISRVTMNEQTFSATAIQFPGGVSGFHEDAGALGSRLMIVQPDGAARLALLPSHNIWVGLCETS